MKDLLQRYFEPPTGDDHSTLWEEAIVSFDANVILGLYTTSEKTRGELLWLLEQLGDRLWLSHQAAMEFLENRPGKASEAEQQLVKSLENALKSIGKFEQKRRDCREEIKGVVSKAKAALNEALGAAESMEAAARDIPAADPLLDSVSTLFENKLGKELDSPTMVDRQVEAGRRYRVKIPPGYEDAMKPGVNPFGDCLIWFEMLHLAKERQKPVIFVTDDQKEDWVEKTGTREYSPRRELIREMSTFAGVRYWQYTTRGFHEAGLKHFERDASPQVVDELSEMERRAVVNADFLDDSFADTAYAMAETVALANKYFDEWQPPPELLAAMERFERTRTHLEGTEAWARMMDSQGAASAVSRASDNLALGGRRIPEHPTPAIEDPEDDGQCG